MLSATATANPEAAAPESIRNTAAEILERSYYSIDVAADRSGEAVLLKILRWILKPFQDFFELIEGLPLALQWVIIAVAVVLCIVLVAHIAITLGRAVGSGARRSKGLTGLTSHGIDPEQFERSAAEARGAGNLVEAIHWLMRAAVRRLELAEKRDFPPGMTNRELLRRYRETGASNALQRLVDAVDVYWYGGQACPADAFADCNSDYQHICTYARTVAQPPVAS